MLNGQNINKHTLAALVGHYRNGCLLEQMVYITGFPEDFIITYLTSYLSERNEAPDKRILSKQNTDK